MQRLALAIVAALTAALAVVSLSTAASHRIQRPPHRIISLSPTDTEDLFAIGAGKQVVAVDQDSNYPKRAPGRASPATRRTSRRSRTTTRTSFSSRTTRPTWPRNSATSESR